MTEHKDRFVPTMALVRHELALEGELLTPDDIRFRELAATRGIGHAMADRMYRAMLDEFLTGLQRPEEV